MKATELLKRQHQRVKELFQQLQQTADADRRGELIDEIAEDLETHMMIEEGIFYPAVREESGAEEMEAVIPQAYEEHHVVKLLLEELPEIDCPPGIVGASKDTVMVPEYFKWIGL